MNDKILSTMPTIVQIGVGIFWIFLVLGDYSIEVKILGLISFALATIIPLLSNMAGHLVDLHNSMINQTDQLLRQNKVRRKS